MSEGSLSRRPLRIAQVVAFLCDLCGARFYGEVTIRFRDGRPVMVEKTETFADALPVKNPALVDIMETAGVRSPASDTAAK